MIFKRTVLAAIAVSMLAVPVAQAEQRFDGRRGHEYGHTARPDRYAPQRHDFRKPAPTHRHWVKGNRLPDWRRRPAIRDYHRYGLKRPGRGQQWVRVDNDFLLISLATGVVAGIIAGR